MGADVRQATRDINRLASLSAEGRSSATTILIAALLRWMHGAGSEDLPEAQRKLLALTDNRQDAALQAGHFNDFVFVTLMRACILAALDASGEEGLTHDTVGQAGQTDLGFIGANTGRRENLLGERAHYIWLMRGCRRARPRQHRCNDASVLAFCDKRNLTEPIEV